MRALVPGETCRDKPPWVLRRDRVGSPCVATGVIRVAKGFWAVGVLCRDTILVLRSDAASLVGFMSRHDFCVATATLPGGLKYIAT